MRCLITAPLLCGSCAYGSPLTADAARGCVRARSSCACRAVLVLCSCCAVLWCAVLCCAVLCCGCRYRVRLFGTDEEAATEEYMLPGSQTKYAVRSVKGRGLHPGDEFKAAVAYRHRSDAAEEGGGWQRDSGPVAFQTHPALAEWRVKPQVKSVTEEEASIKWSSPPVPDTRGWEYYVKVTDGETKEDMIVSKPRVKLTSFGGQPLQLGQHLRVTVESRLKVDADDEDGGWGHRSSEVHVRLPEPEVPVEPVDMNHQPTVKALEENLADIVVGWDAVPNADPSKIE